MEYLVEQLQHDDETDSQTVEEQINGRAKEGWVLHSTQFLPWVVERDKGDKPDEWVGAGHLMLIFQRPKS